MIFDKKREYEILLNETTMMIDNLRGMKEDVVELTQRLNSVMSNTVSLGNFQAKQKIDYSAKIKVLKGLQKDLAKYELIYKINASVQYLNAFIKEGVNKSNVSKCATEIITSLKILKSIDVSLIKEFDEVFDNFYECAYNVIKLEFIYKGSSNVLDYILKDKVHILSINNLIKRDVLRLSESINDVPYLNKLKMSLFEIDKSGIDKNYVNKDVFKTLVICTDPDKMRESVLNEIELKINELEDNVKKLTKNINKKNESYRKIRLIKGNITNSFKDLKKRVLAIVLSGGVTLGVYSWLVSDLKEFSTKYSTTTTLYSSLEDTPQSTTEFASKLKEDFNVELNVFNKIIDEGLGIKALYDYNYDVTDYISEDFDYSTLLDVKDAGIKFSSREIIKRFGWGQVPSDIEESYQYVVTTQDKSKFEFNQEEYEKHYFYLSLFTIFMYTAFNLIFLKSYKLLKDVNEISSNKEKRIKEIEASNDLVNKIKRLFDANEKLKNQFSSILSEKGFLLDDEKMQSLTAEFDEYYNQSKALKKVYNSSNYGDLDN